MLDPREASLGAGSIPGHAGARSAHGHEFVRAREDEDVAIVVVGRDALLGLPLDGRDPERPAQPAGGGARTGAVADRERGLELVATRRELDRNGVVPRAGEEVGLERASEAAE